MLLEILNVLAGLIVGLGTGFYFERRGVRAARAQHELALQSNRELLAYIGELEEQLTQSQSELQRSVKHVQESIYSSSGSDAGATRGKASIPLDREHLLQEIRARLDVDGRVSRAAVRAAFLTRGHQGSDIDALIDELVGSNTIRIAGRSLELA